MPESDMTALIRERAGYTVVQDEGEPSLSVESIGGKADGGAGYDMPMPPRSDINELLREAIRDRLRQASGRL